MLYQELDTSSTEHSQGDSSSIREILEWLLKNWYWFVISLSITMTYAYFHLRYADNLYRAEAKILIKPDPSQQRSELSVLTSRGMGGMSGVDNLGDQIQVMTSRRLMEKVVKNLDLNVRYFTEGRVKTIELFDNSSPIKVSVLSADPSFLSFEVQTLSDSRIDIIQGDHKIQSSLGKPVKLGQTEFTVLPRSGSSVRPGQHIQVSILPPVSAAGMFKSRLSITPVKEGLVLSVSAVDNIPDRAKLVIDELIKQYSEDAIEDKRVIGEKTTRFINERLDKVAEDLQSKDRDVELFKKTHNVIDLGAEGSTRLSESSGNYTKEVEQTTQLTLVNAMQDYLNTHKNEPLPQNIGLSDGAVNSAAGKLNELLLARNKLLQDATENHPAVKNLEDQIADVDQELKSSLANYKKTIQISLNRTQSEGGLIDSKIQAFPTKEKEFKNIARQQQIVEGLYLFLLQKREENEITNAATPSAVKVVDHAVAGRSPIAPNHQTTYLTAAGIGLLVPFGILYLVFLFNYKVQGRKELEKTGVSVIGEIPKARANKRVSPTDRTTLAESFRILRTNISFYMTKKKEGSKNIFVTSTVSGEGKTFLATNLASILGASETEKVLLLGADIRSPVLLKVLELPQYKSHKGLTEFLVDTAIDLDAILIRDHSLPFDLITAGALAPNPAELLMTERWAELFSELSERYDYVIVDTAPVSLVADTQIIAAQADLFLYVVRANYLDKRMLEIPERLFKDKKLPKMALVLNDSDPGKGYGYRYGSYGYGYTSDRPKGWRKFHPKNIIRRLF